MRELRRNPIDGTWVVVNPERAARPDRFADAVEVTGGMNDADGCPFCPGHETETPPEVARSGEGAPDTPGWRVRVVPNLYPIVDGPARPVHATRSRFHDAAHATGAHEVAVLSPDHHRELADLSGVEVEELFEVLVARTRHHLAQGHTYVQLLVNHGQRAGASIEHPHFQIAAIDLAPPAVAREATNITSAAECPVCRAVSEDADATAPLAVMPRGRVPLWCPWWSGVPFEFMVAPREHTPRIEHSGPDIGLAARAVALGLDFLRQAVGNVAYNLVVHTAPTTSPVDFHWHVHVWPRTTIQAGFEQGTGILVNSMPPERAAAALRSGSDE